ncbi:MAG TPA: hypothetical protein VFZ34_29650 [Blastocatellia bacterium]|nr:hypothetical protein [Blastocatellia bacterium]
MNDIRKKIWDYGRIWLLFFLICFGLGYSGLTRFDARANNSDVIQYYQLVVNSPREASGRWRQRILVPFLAKPFYLFARGRSGNWEPVFFGLLVVNSSFCATTVCLLLVMGKLIVPAVAPLAATIYLLNFAITNFQLSGLVDSAEACFMMVITWALFTQRWMWLLIAGIFGALAKETFVPLAAVYALIWWTTAMPGEFRTTALPWILGMITLSLGTVTVVHSTIAGITVWPWNILVAENIGTNLWQELIWCFTDQRFWYVFIWLLPFGVWRITKLPRPWLFASVSAALMALVLGIFAAARGHVARPMFDVAGPILSLSAALLLSEIVNSVTPKKKELEVDG